MANTYLTNTNPTAGNRTKGTISVWFKRSGLGSYQHLYTEHYDGNNFGSLRLNNSDTLSFLSYDGGSAQADIGTTRVFRDTNAWYHVVVSWDTTNGTASDRVKIYINGVRETSFSGSPTYPSSSQSIYFGVGGTNYPIRVGSISNSAQFFDGSMSHFHRVDNQALAQTVFGETDSTTGEWKIKTSPSITYTGSSDFNFFILKDGNSVTDQSGQSNNLTVGGGTLSKTEDSPSNIFATLNPLVNIGTTTTYSEGNNTVSTSNANYKVSPSTLAVSSGKWYMEFKAVSGGFGTIDACVGILPTDTAFSTGSNNLNAYTNGSSYGSHGQVKQSGSGTLYTGSTYADGDIIGIALDMDNHKLYFRKNNNAWENSGDPTSGSTGTGAVSITSGIEYYFACASIASGGTKVFSANFGNGSFGSTQLTGTTYQANGLGIFKYQPPTSYTALCTKGLNL